VLAFSLSTGLLSWRQPFLSALEFSLNAGLSSQRRPFLIDSLSYKHWPFLSVLALLSVLTFATVSALAFSTGSSHHGLSLQYQHWPSITKLSVLAFLAASAVVVSSLTAGLYNNFNPGLLNILALIL
jgi:hypothetical protein